MVESVATVEVIGHRTCTLVEAMAVTPNEGEVVGPWELQFRIFLTA